MILAGFSCDRKKTLVLSTNKSSLRQLHEFLQRGVRGFVECSMKIGFCVCDGEKLGEMFQESF